MSISCWNDAFGRCADCFSRLTHSQQQLHACGLHCSAVCVSTAVYQRNLTLRCFVHPTGLRLTMPADWWLLLRRRMTCTGARSLPV